MDGFYLAFGEGLSEEANRLAQALARLLLEDPPEGLWEAVPAYGTLYLEYDPRRLSRKGLLGLVSRLEATLAGGGEEG
ncbi:MAG: carboxyltransferase domain-containing protein, partial [Thermus sp.]